MTQDLTEYCKVVGERASIEGQEGTSTSETLRITRETCHVRECKPTETEPASVAASWPVPRRSHKGCTPSQKAEEGLRAMEAQWQELCAEATETQRCNAEKIVDETIRVDRARELLEKEETSMAPVDNSHELQCVCTKAL